MMKLNILRNMRKTKYKKVNQPLKYHETENYHYIWFIEESENL